MKIKSKILRVLSLFLALSLTLETLLPADIALAFQSQVPVAMEPLLNEKTQISKYARVEWLKASSSVPSRGVVYLIQDAHSSLLAQKRITETLQYLKNQKLLDSVLVEGVAGRLTSERFAHIESSAQKAEIIETLERQGYLHGAAAFSLMVPEVSASGLESADLYRRNFELFRQVMQSEKEVQRAVSAFQVEWQRWLKQGTQKDDYDFFLNSASSHAFSEGSGYFEQLIAMASRELGIQWEIRDQKVWPNLIRLQRMLEIQPRLDMQKAREGWAMLKKALPALAAREGAAVETLITDDKASFYSEEALRRFAAKAVQEFMSKRLPMRSYRHFFDWLALVVFQKEIKPEDLIREVELIEDRIWDKKFKEPEARRAMKLGRMAALLDQAGRLELSRGAVRRFTQMTKDSDFQFWMSQLLPETKQIISQFSEQVLSFYAVAERREKAFFEKLNRAVEAATAHQLSLPHIAIVTGGYHKEGLLKYLKPNGFDVAVMLPRLDQIDQDVAYRERMLESAVETSTLSMVPAAAVSRAELPELVGAPMADLIESDLTEALRKSETRGRDDVAQVIPESSRRGFLIGAAAFLSFPVVSFAQDALDQLLQEAGKPSVVAPQAEFKAAIFPIANLQMGSSGGMEGYLTGIMNRVSQNLPGLKNKWNRVLAEVERMRVTRISLMASYSPSGGLQGGVRISGMAGDVLEISDGGLSLVMKTIGFLLDEILVNPVLNQADAASIRAAEMSYQWKKTQLAGEAARLILMLKAAESKFKVLQAYVNHLSQAENQVRVLAASKSATDEQLNNVSSFLNEAKDAQGQLQVEITQAREGLKMLLGADFNFEAAVVPVPVRAWLDSSEKEQAKLVAAAQNRAGRVLSAQASQAQTEAFEKSAKAEKRRGILSFVFRRGPAKPDKTRQDLGLESDKISSNPDVARAQVMAESERVQAQSLTQELKALVGVEAAKFSAAQNSHARWQKQVYEEQLAWRTRGLLAADYDLDMLTLLKRFVQAQVRVLETRAQMSGAAVVWTTAGLEDQSAGSQNWMNPVLFSGFFPSGFAPAALPVIPKRSEVRTLINKAGVWVVQMVILLSMSFSAWAQQTPVVSGPPGIAAQTSAEGVARIWEEKGKIHMSSAAGEKPSLMSLKLPEIVTVDPSGQVKLSSEGQLRQDHLRREFEADLKAYTHLKSGGAKLSELLPRFKILFEKGLELDRFERVVAAMALTESSQFKVIQKQPGTYGVNQSAVEMVSTRIAKVQIHVPLRELLGAKIKIEIAGQSAVLISRPRVIELDARGSEGRVLIELSAAVDQPIDFGSETEYQVWLEKEGDNASVSSGEPAEILIRDASGAEVSAGVALLLRDRLAVAMPDFGVPQLQPQVEAGMVEDGRKVAAISFQRTALFDFFINESHILGEAAQSILPSITNTGIFTQQQISQLTQDAEIARTVASRLESQRSLMSSASGMLEISPELAAGFPMNQGEAAAWVQTRRVLLKAAIAGNAERLAEGDSVAVRLADGRQITGKIQSVSAEDKAHLYGRKNFVAEFDVPVDSSELDWSALVSRNGFSPALLFSLLAQAHQLTPLTQSGLMPNNIEFSGAVGVGATMAKGTQQPARVPTLADLIASDADPLQAHQLFKQHQSGFGAEDYKPLLESKHLSLVYETVKLLLRERGEWAEVMRAFDIAQKQGDLARSRALYDAMVTALVSGGKEIELGLAKLGVQSRADQPLREISERVFSALAAERGMNDSGSRRVLDSQFWNATELLQFASNLQAGSSPEIRGLSGGVFEMIWRTRANEQIGAIQNSAYWGKMLAGRDPEHALTWLDQDSILEELVYRDSLISDQRLLRDGAISGEAVLPPSVASLIDPQTAEKVSIPSTQATRPVALLQGVLGTQPVTLGELDVLSVEQQEQAMRAAASRGDLELLTWVLSSRMSGHLKQTAVSILQNSEQGPLVFARWFARQSDISLASSALKNYGLPRFLADLNSEMMLLEKQMEEGESHRSLAPARQIIFETLFRLYLRDVYPLQNKQTDSVLRQLLMLVNDPADLGKLVRGEKPASLEAQKMAALPGQVLQNAALKELARRSLHKSAVQYPLLNQSRAMVGEIRPEGTMNQLSVLRTLLQPDSFTDNPLFEITSEAEAVAAMKAELAKHITNADEAQKLGELAEAHYQAGWTGKVIVPSAFGHQAGFVWTIFSYAKNLTGLFVLGIFSWLFFRQAVVRARKVKAMQRGEAVQFYDSLPAWKKDFEEEILQSGVVKDGEGKNRVVLGLKEWSDLLASPTPDYARILVLANEIFNWPNLSMRLENFKGFRHDDRQRDRILIFALTSLSYLTLKQLSEQDEATQIQEKIYLFLKDRSHRLVIFSYILFQLKNLKENESYNAVEPNIANSEIQKLRLKAYRFQQRVWPPVRKIYAMDQASKKIRRSLDMLVKEYENISVQIGDSAGDANSQQIKQVIQARYNPREPWGKSPDNATIAGDRKLATRIFNFVAALGSIPAIIGQLNLVFVLFPMIGGAGVTAVVLPLFFLNAIMLFSAFTYLSHLYANLANLHDVQAEEFLDHLSRVEGLMEIKPRAEAPAAVVPARPISVGAQPSPAKESLRKSVTVPAPQVSVVSVDPILDAEQVSPQPPSTVGWRSLLFSSAPVVSASSAAVSEVLIETNGVTSSAIESPVNSSFVAVSQWRKWQDDADIAAVIVFVTKGDAKKQEEILTAFSARHKLTKINLDDVDAGHDLQARMKEARGELLPGAPFSKKVIFLQADSSGQYQLLQEHLDETAETVERTDQPLKIEDLVGELEFSQKRPGFDAVVVTVNQEDAEALRPVIKNLIQKKYGYPVPVAVIGVAGVSGGNGVPALGTFTDQTQMDNELRKDNPHLPGVDRMKLIVLEAYGPDLDIANLTAGSIFLSPTGIKDRRGNAVTTGALALARAAISMREVKTPAQFRFKTDTYNLNRLRSHLPGDITFAVTELPASEVVGRFGVPIFSDKKRTKIKGFFEKVDSFEKLRHLYKQRTGIEITSETKVPVFTGDIALQFKNSERQKAFQNLTLNLTRFFKTTLQTSPAFQFDEVLDFWVPLIMSESKAKGDIKDLLVSYAGYRAKVSNDGRPRSDQDRIQAAKVYSELYFEILNQVQSFGLNLSIHGIVDQGEFSDVRDVEPLVRLNRANLKASTQTALVREPDSALDEDDEDVTTFGLNGNRPSEKLKGLLMASVPMRKGNETFEAIVYGMRGAWGIDRLRSFEETHLGFNTDLFVDESGKSFLNSVDFRKMPLFPTRMTQPAQTNRLVGAAKLLTEGKKVRVQGGAAALRKAGYVSLEDILNERDFPGMDAPVHKYLVEGPVRRSELRTLTQLVRTGAAVAALLIFSGILPAHASFAAEKIQSYSELMMRQALESDFQAEILKGADVPEDFAIADAIPQNVLFVDGNLVVGRQILPYLKSLSSSQFKIEILFTDADQHDKAKQAIGGAQLGALRLRLGPTLGEMVQELTAAQVRENPDMKKSFAFLGSSDNAVRRVRATIANLMVLKDAQSIPAAMLLEALLSPAIFSLNFRPNKIWSMDLVLPMLLAARQIARSA